MAGLGFRAVILGGRAERLELARAEIQEVWRGLLRHRPSSLGPLVDRYALSVDRLRRGTFRRHMDLDAFDVEKVGKANEFAAEGARTQ